MAEPPGVEGTPRQKLYGRRRRPRAEAWGNTHIQQASRGTGAQREAAKGSLDRWEEAEGELKRESFVGPAQEGPPSSEADLCWAVTG